MNANKRVVIQPGVPWESHPDYLPWFWTVSHFRVSPRPIEVSYTESAEERNAAALAFLDSVLGGTRATTSTCPYELRQALVEVRRTLRGLEATKASTTGPSSNRYSSHYTRCWCRDRTWDLVFYDLFLIDFMAIYLFWTLYGHDLWTTFRGGMTFVLLRMNISIFVIIGYRENMNAK
ncbi:hypothetical protein RHGRI_016843 [Rhododendron griersonianum]|uniref:Uncharacterized protein n=1 Tax=Rhododendron griersonianum TaxID=479676 RepID=A0AAV6JVJ8_9ERIC|nr:hypothetical protein RHGRI_016843 [Rhododendron griersonianum]